MKKDFLDCNCENLEEKIIGAKKVKRFGQVHLLTNVPATVCRDCGEVYINSQVYKNLENKLFQQAKNELIAA
jgi:YgiT-type zinc finger domain-containing protein